MKWVKVILTISIIGFVAYNSVYFKKLDEVKAAKSGKEFNAAEYATTFWSDKLIPSLTKAVDLTQLTQQLSSDPEKAFDEHSHALGIGNLRYFLVKISGTVDNIEADYIKIGEYKVATEFIFGNAVRDASGEININEFTNTMDFNNVSAEINKIIREKVLPSFKNSIKKGDKIEVVGAVELNKEHVDLPNIEIIPVQLKIIQ